MYIYILFSSPSALCKDVLTDITQKFHAPQKVLEPQEENCPSPPLLVRPIHCFLCVVEAAFVVLQAVGIQT